VCPHRCLAEGQLPAPKLNTGERRLVRRCIQPAALLPGTPGAENAAAPDHGKILTSLEQVHAKHAGGHRIPRWEREKP